MYLHAVIQLRVFGASREIADVVSELEEIPGSRHVVLTETEVPYQSWTYYVFRKRLGGEQVAPPVAFLRGDSTRRPG